DPPVHSHTNSGEQVCPVGQGVISLHEVRPSTSSSMRAVDETSNCRQPPVESVVESMLRRTRSMRGNPDSPRSTSCETNPAGIENAPMSATVHSIQPVVAPWTLTEKLTNTSVCSGSTFAVSQVKATGDPGATEIRVSEVTIGAMPQPASVNAPKKSPEADRLNAAPGSNAGYGSVSVALYSRVIPFGSASSGTRRPVIVTLPADCLVGFGTHVSCPAHVSLAAHWLQKRSRGTKRSHAPSEATTSK